MNAERVLAGPSRPKTMHNSDFRPTACEARALQDASSALFFSSGHFEAAGRRFHLLGLPYSALVLSVGS